jgi:hypothetical protein
MTSLSRVEDEDESLLSSSGYVFGGLTFLSSSAYFLMNSSISSSYVGFGSGDATFAGDWIA